jgi:hypothetical protein
MAFDWKLVWARPACVAMRDDSRAENVTGCEWIVRENGILSVRCDKLEYPEFQRMRVYLEGK